MAISALVARSWAEGMSSTALFAVSFETAASTKIEGRRGLNVNDKGHYHSHSPPAPQRRIPNDEQRLLGPIGDNTATHVLFVLKLFLPLFDSSKNRKMGA